MVSSRDLSVKHQLISTSEMDKIIQDFPLIKDLETTNSATQRLAISDGGLLVIESNASRTLTDALIQTAKKYPDKGIIYIQPDGSQRMQTYAELLAEAKSILTGLVSMGLTSKDTAILQLTNLQDYFPTFWACLLGGIKPVTVAIAPTYEQNNAVVGKLFNTWMLLERPSILASDSLVDSLLSLRNFLPMEDLKVLAVNQLHHHPPVAQIYDSQQDETVFFQLTSGSTGVPKCIQETHRGIICHIHASKQFNGYRPEDISLNWLPMDHVVPLLTYHLKDVYLGCQQVQVPTHLILSNPLYWLDLIEKYQVTHSWSPNFGFKLVSNELAKADNRQWDLSSLKFLMNAGEQVTLPVVRRFLHLVTPFKVSSQVMQPAFGMAEVCTCITYQNHFHEETGVHRWKKSSLNSKLQPALEDNESQIATFVELGLPVPGVQIRIVDKNNQLLSEGAIGRLQIKGDVVTPGYLKNHAANKAAFVGDSWFNTGDLGYLLNDRLTLTSREKEIIIINGANLYCHEIEDLVNELEGIEPTYIAACGIDNPEIGTEELAIFFTPKVASITANLPIIIQAIKTKVAFNLEINPTFVIPIAKQDFPKTTSGKIQRTQLKNFLMSGHFQDILKAIDLQQNNINTIPDWFYQPIWQPKTANIKTSEIPHGSYLVFLDRLGLGEYLGSELEKLNQYWVGVQPGENFAQLAPNRYQINPANSHHYHQLLQSLAREGIIVNQILQLWTYGEFREITSLSDLEYAQELGVYSLLFFIQALAQEKGNNPTPIRLLVGSSYAQATTPNEVIAPEKSPILGLCQVVSQELPWLQCRHVDLLVELVEQNAVYLLQELKTVTEERRVAYRQGQRFIPYLKKVDWYQQPKREIPFRRGGLYLVSGGLGGIGVEIAKYLLQNYDARVLLVGRTALPQRNEWDYYLQTNDDEIAQKIKAYLSLEKLGGEIYYYDVDISNYTQLQQVLTQIQSLTSWQIDGIIHLAGVFQERLLIDETQESFATQLRTKVLGTWVLHQLIKTQPQALFIHFSSVINSMFGGAMAGAYAAANSFLDSFSYYQRSQCAMQSYCFNWSMWDEVGMSRGYALKELFYARGFQPITVREGLQSLRLALSHNPAHLLVGLTVQQAQMQSSSERVQPPSNLQHNQITSNSQIQRQISQIWQEVLGVSQVSIDDNFFAIGGSSLPLIQVHSRLQTIFGQNFSITELFKYPTIFALAQRLSQANHTPPILQAPSNLAQVRNTRKVAAGRQRQLRQSK